MSLSKEEFIETCKTDHPTFKLFHGGHLVAQEWVNALKNDTAAGEYDKLVDEFNLVCKKLRDMDVFHWQFYCLDSFKDDNYSIECVDHTSFDFNEQSARFDLMRNKRGVGRLASVVWGANRCFYGYKVNLETRKLEKEPIFADGSQERALEKLWALKDKL